MIRSILVLALSATVLAGCHNSSKASPGAADGGAKACCPEMAAGECDKAACEKLIAEGKCDKAACDKMKAGGCDKMKAGGCDKMKAGGCDKMKAAAAGDKAAAGCPMSQQN